VTEDFEITRDCDVCGRDVPHGPTDYSGRYLSLYRIFACHTCIDDNQEGWALDIEHRVTRELRRINDPLPPRNPNGRLPRE
jgi:hypothetical protein